MEVLELRDPVLSRDVVVDHARLERTRSIERDQGDDLPERAGLELQHEVGHARRFDLEHALRVAPTEQVVGDLIVHRDGVYVERLEALLLADHALRVRHQREGLEPEEVELDEADLLDVDHVVLGHHVTGLRVLVERDHVDQRLRPDHDAGGVLRGVTGEPFEALRRIDQTLHLGVGVHQRA